MIYETHPSRNQRKRALREINYVSHVMTSDSKWSDTPITFGQDDQPTSDPTHFLRHKFSDYLESVRAYFSLSGFGD